MHYLLFYEVADDYMARRAEFRQAHLAKAWAASEHGELVLAGALTNPPDTAILLFQGDSPEVAETAMTCSFSTDKIGRFFMPRLLSGGNWRAVSSTSLPRAALSWPASPRKAKLVLVLVCVKV